MRYTFVICAVLFITLTLSACQPAATADKAALMERGEGIYTHSCVRCHHADGSGYLDLFPALAGNPIVTLHDPVPVIQVIQHGRGSMPAYRDVMSNDEMAAVITYIRNSWGNEAPAIPPRQIR